MLTQLVNQILGDHNVDKQMTDSRGEVCSFISATILFILIFLQVAYLMADLSDVNIAVIKDLYQRLEELDCKNGASFVRSAMH